MAYVHDTHFSQFTPPNLCAYTAGTWTPTVASNVLSDVRTAADASFSIYIPILLPSNESVKKGAYLKSIDIFYKIATAAADDFTVRSLSKMTLPAHGTAVTGAAVTVSLDTGNDTDAECKAVGDHTMTITVTTPVWVDDGECFFVTLTVDAAATTAFNWFGAVAHFTLRC